MPTPPCNLKDADQRRLVRTGRVYEPVITRRQKDLHTKHRLWAYRDGVTGRRQERPRNRPVGGGGMYFTAWRAGGTHGVAGRRGQARRDGTPGRHGKGRGVEQQARPGRQGGLGRLMYVATWQQLHHVCIHAVHVIPCKAPPATQLQVAVWWACSGYRPTGRHGPAGERHTRAGRRPSKTAALLAS